VTVPGGYVGLNESTWLKTPVPTEVVAWASQDLGANVKPLTPEEWQDLLVGAGLSEVFVRISPISTKEEAKGHIDRYGWGGTLRSMGRMFRLYFKNPNYREFLKSIRQSGITPPNLEEYFGYGIFIGRK
jgi:hypothetical protein